MSGNIAHGRGQQAGQIGVQGAKPSNQDSGPAKGRPLGSRIFTVIGYLSSGATFCRPYEVDDSPGILGWPKAAQQAMEDYRDLQMVVVLQGDVRLVGTWENLPDSPPVFAITDLLHEKRFSVFGFNKARDEEELFGIDAKTWVHAAHAVMRSRGSVYQFVGAAQGLVTVAGKWSTLKASVTIGEAAAEQEAMQ